MKAFLAMIILFSGFDSVAQIRLPDEATGTGCCGPSGIRLREDLRGKIRHIAERFFPVRTDSITGKKIVADSATAGNGFWYDEHGNVLTQTFFRKGEEKTYILNTYDDKLRLIKGVDVKNGRTMDSIIYNDDKKKITWYQHWPWQPELSVYFFDKEDNPVKKMTRTKNGITLIQTYEYDNKKRVINIIRRNPFGSRDEDDTLTYENSNKENSEIVRKYRLTKGTKTLDEESIISAKKHTKVCRPYYSSTDSLVMTTEGSILYNSDTKTTCFDSRNRIVYWLFNEWPDEKTTYEYEIDSKGNWIEERIFEKGELFILTRRIIEYFE